MPKLLEKYVINNEKYIYLLMGFNLKFIWSNVLYILRILEFNDLIVDLKFYKIEIL